MPALSQSRKLPQFLGTISQELHQPECAAVFVSTEPAYIFAATCRGPWRPLHWTPPSTFRPPEVLTEVEVIEAEAELKVLQRHVLQVVDPKMGV